MWGPDRAKGKVEELYGKARRVAGKLVDNAADQGQGDDRTSRGQARQAAAEGDNLGDTRIEPDSEST